MHLLDNPLLRREAQAALGRYRLLVWPWPLALLLALGLLLLTARARTSAHAGRLFDLFLGLQLIWVVLITPALTAGALAEEKERGTLPLLFTTHLTALDILLGKLVIRAALVVRLGMVALPVLLFLAGVTGLAPGLLVVLVAQLTLVAYAVGAVSVLASVATRRTREAVLVAYAAVAAGLALWSAGALGWLDPGPVWEVFWDTGGGPGLRAVLLPHAAAWLLVGTLCLALAALRLRPEAARHLEGPAPARGRSAPWRPPVADDPVAWREQWVVGLAPLAWLRRIPLPLALALVLAASTGLHYHAWFPQQPTGWGRPQVTPLLVGEVFQVVGATLVVVVARAAGALRSEREGQTWDTLRLTPLTLKQVVRAKAVGIQRTVWPYLVAWLGPPAVLVLGTAEPWALVAVAAAFGLARTAATLATAVGLKHSARPASEWRALIAALVEVGCLAFGYAAAVLFLTAFFTCMTCSAVMVGSHGGSQALLILLAFLVGSLGPAVLAYLYQNHGQRLIEGLGEDLRRAERRGEGV